MLLNRIEARSSHKEIDMDEKELRKIIRQGEGLTIEFKRAKNALPDNLFDSIAAFLNRNGGHIILGVTDDKKIEGVTVEYLLALLKYELYVELLIFNNLQKDAVSIFLACDGIIIRS